MSWKKKVAVGASTILLTALLSGCTGIRQYTDRLSEFMNGGAQYSELQESKQEMTDSNSTKTSIDSVVSEQAVVMQQEQNADYLVKEDSPESRPRPKKKAMLAFFQDIGDFFSSKKESEVQVNTSKAAMTLESIAKSPAVATKKDSTSDSLLPPPAGQKTMIAEVSYKNKTEPVIENVDLEKVTVSVEPRRYPSDVYMENRDNMMRKVEKSKTMLAKLEDEFGPATSYGLEIGTFYHGRINRGLMKAMSRYCLENKSSVDFARVSATFKELKEASYGFNITEYGLHHIDDFIGIDIKGIAKKYGQFSLVSRDDWKDFRNFAVLIDRGLSLEHTREFLALDDWHDVDRYSNSLIRDQLILANPNHKPRRDIAVAVFNKADHNRAFTKAQKHLDELTRGYTVFIREAANDFEAVEAVEQIKSQYGAVEMLGIFGHGTGHSLKLGDNELAGKFDMGDFYLYKQLDNAIDGAVLLYSCSNAYGETKRAAEKMINGEKVVIPNDNLARYMSAFMPDKKIFACPLDMLPEGSELHFNRRGKLRDVTWSAVYKKVVDGVKSKEYVKVPAVIYEGELSFYAARDMRSLTSLTPHEERVVQFYDNAKGGMIVSAREY